MELKKIGHLDSWSIFFSKVFKIFVPFYWVILLVYFAKHTSIWTSHDKFHNNLSQLIEWSHLWHFKFLSIYFCYVFLGSDSHESRYDSREDRNTAANAIKCVCFFLFCKHRADENVSEPFRTSPVFYVSTHIYITITFKIELLFTLKLLLFEMFITSYLLFLFIF